MTDFSVALTLGRSTTVMGSGIKQQLTDTKINKEYKLGTSSNIVVKCQVICDKKKTDIT